MKRAVFILMLLVCGCATNDVTLQAITAVAQVEAATIPSFVAWDRQHQMEIASKYREASDVEAGEKVLADYRAKRDAIVRTLITLEQAAADGKLPDVHTLYQELIALCRAVGFSPGGL